MEGQTPPLGLDGRDALALLEVLPIRLALFDQASRYLYANRAYAAFAGMDAAQLAGRTADEVLGARLMAVQHESVRRVLQGEMVESEGWAEFPPPAGRRYVRYHFLPRRDAAGVVSSYFVLADDQTELHEGRERLAQKLEALHASQALTAAILKTALDCVITIDEYARVVEFNPAAEAVFGYSRAEVIGRDMGQLIVPSHMRKQHEAGMSRYLRSGQSKVIGRRIEMEALHAKGHCFPVELAITEINLPDRRFFTAYLRDLTEEKAQQAQLAQARRDAEEAYRARSRFLTAMSHEIRTPLQGILGAAALLRATQQDADQRRLSDVIVASGDHLLSLINDVLDYSRLAASPVVLHDSVFDLHAALRLAVDLLAPAAAQKGVALHLQIAPALPQMVVGDAARLRQVLLNILGNSVKFTEQGEVLVRAAARAGAPCEPPLGPPGTPDGFGLDVSVADTGIGIAETALGNLFTEFSQAEGDIGRRYGGTGLGLAISRRLVAAMGGQITVQSRLGEGSTFTFTVQLRRAPAGAAAAAAAQNAEPSLPRQQVLLVDDNSTNLLIARLFLEQMGHAVDQAQSGAAALAAIATGRYDLVLMDMMMPEMDGLEATRRIRGQPGRAGDVPVIGLTASASAEDAAACQAAGMQAVLTKPFTRTQLGACMAQVLAADGQDSASATQA